MMNALLAHLVLSEQDVARMESDPLAGKGQQLQLD